MNIGCFLHGLIVTHLLPLTVLSLKGLADDFLAGTCSWRVEDPAARIIQSLYSAVAEADCELANPCAYPPDYDPTDGEEFDFIIVGAGSAGSTLANRLSEVNAWRVLLLEAGGDPPKASEVPAFFPLLQNTDVDWQYVTEPDGNYCVGVKDKKCVWPRGKVLGGSSTINYMIYVRGNPKDYDRWAEEGNKGWSYSDVLPYFKKSEDMRAREVLETREAMKYHGTKGPLKVDTFYNDEWKPINKIFGGGMNELGYHINHDCNGKNQSGFVRFQGTLQDGRRCSTAKAFLSSINQRTNLKVSKKSLVTKILIDSYKKIAYGIKFLNKEGRTVEVRAKREIILSAGAINTPQLLMLSGIGPKNHLDKLNIKVIRNLPVGENLQDHPLMYGLVLSLKYSTQETNSVQENMFRFLMKEKSAYSELGLATGGFISTENNPDYPDIEFFIPDFTKENTIGLLGFLGAYNYTLDIQKRVLDIHKDSNIILIASALLRPYSRGKILLKSINPTDHPEIIPGYFSDKRDIETFLRFYNFTGKLIKTKSFKDSGAKLEEIRVDGCSEFQYASEEYRECSMRYLTNSNYHVSGTCKMGPASSPHSVVDQELKVLGIDKLRVVDASIMPNIVSGNINAAVIMIAEKGSDIIKGAHLSRSRRESHWKRRRRKRIHRKI